MAQSVASSIVSLPPGPVKHLSVEHPSGEFSVELELDPTSGGETEVVRSSLIRTARALFRGEVLVPAGILKSQATLKHDI
jgi:4-oxalomesaconate tautomerase